MNLVLSISALENRFAARQAEIEGLRCSATSFEEGTPQRRTATAKLDAAERSLYAHTRVVAWAKRRLALFRALGVERCMEPPLIMD